ncbi:hypothetical protein [Candidatus Marinarcus aquaticus]|uniref:Uncharacterized protein n=1 Tax=Candidatus Marinarcus aquaticus TaxID=2044504 RepID=A0A4Q0XUL8_9BACT|nr:hypothetical protein [Candidatus Marinarcus aquaticus]RXJ60264.1 hypothetical protein CRV04_04480 [Candidatus Marinarcus aquaticus]
MEEIVVSKEELIKMFEDERIIDSGRGWMMDNEEVELIALHEVDPKFLQDITNAKFYKITVKGKK